MDIKQDQAVKRLLKKLSALRATLNNDERRMLDELVLGSVDEVQLQSMKTGQKQAVKLQDADEVKLQSMKTGQKQAVKLQDADEVKLQDADEVKLQSMKTGQKQAVKLQDADEVKLQSMDDERPWHRAIGRVVFDPTKEEYQHI
jgi:hypothetical protein